MYLFWHQYRQGRRHIDDIDQTKISGIFDDDGYEVIPGLIKKPLLCISCSLNINNDEEYLCDLLRYDQEQGKAFEYYDYQHI